MVRTAWLGRLVRGRYYDEETRSNGLDMGCCAHVASLFGEVKANSEVRNNNAVKFRNLFDSLVGLEIYLG